MKIVVTVKAKVEVEVGTGGTEALVGAAGEAMTRAAQVLTAPADEPHPDVVVEVTVPIPATESSRETPFIDAGPITFGDDGFTVDA